jgi:hypothetical protein
MKTGSRPSNLKCLSGRISFCALMLLILDLIKGGRHGDKESVIDTDGSGTDPSGF